MDKIESNSLKNTLTIKLSGSPDHKRVKELAEDIVKESSGLTPGYTMICDFTGLLISAQARDTLMRTIGILTRYDVGKVIRVKPATSDFREVGFDENKALVYHQIEADSFEKALTLI